LNRRGRKMGLKNEGSGLVQLREMRSTDRRERGCAAVKPSNKGSEGVKREGGGCGSGMGEEAKTFPQLGG